MRFFYELAVDWDGDGDFDGAEEIITEDLMSVECRRGRDYASQLTGRSGAGKLRANLRNLSGKYSSLNAASPIYGDIVPARKVRLGARIRFNVVGVTETFSADLPIINIEGLTETHDSRYASYNAVGVSETPNPSYDTINLAGLTETYDPAYPVWYAEGVSEDSDSVQVLWTGYLERVIPGARVASLPTAVLEASGALKRIAGKQINPPAEQDKSTGELIEAVLDAMSWPVGERDIDTGQTKVSRWYVGRKDALNSARDIEETEMGFLLETVDAHIRFEDRHHRLSGEHLVSQATFSDDSASTLKYQEISQQDPLREIYNEAIATVQPLEAHDLQVLWVLRGETPTIDPGETLTWWAEYPNAEIDTENGAYVESWNTPTSATFAIDIIVSGADPADIFRTADKFANSMKISIENRGPVPAVLEHLQARGRPVKKREAARVSDSDAASQAIYGERTYPLQAPWLPNTSQARDFARYVVSRYKDPLPMLAITYLASRSTEHLAQALTRDISDRITVEATGAQTQLGIDTEFFIEAITHRISRYGSRHEVSYELSDASGDAGYWVLGVSLLGINTKLAY